MDILQLCDAWRVNNRLNLELLGACLDETFELKPGKGKTIRSNFVHLVGVRRMWLEGTLIDGGHRIPKLDWRSASRSEIEAGLELSSRLMEELFHLREAKNKPGSWSTIGFFAYCIAHEAHHRSQVEIALRVGGFEPDEKFLYGLWEWSKK